MNAIIYIRVSSLGQAMDGYGLDIQEEAARAYARRVGLTVVRVIADEGVSGTLAAEERPGLMEALTAMQDSTVDALIVARLDRLARSLTVQEAVLAQVWKHGRALHSADTGKVLADDPDDPMRTALRQMAGVFAQLDRGMVVKRMRDGRKAKAARGGHAVGRPAFGWRAEGSELVPVDAEQVILRRILRLHKQGHSTRAIAAALNADPAVGPTKGGAAWSSPVVSRILARHQPRRRTPRAA